MSEACVARIQRSHAWQRHVAAPDARGGFADIVLQITHKVTCPLLERIARARTQLGARQHRVVYLAQTGRGDAWTDQPRAAADVGLLRLLLGAAGVSVFSPAVCQRDLPRYFTNLPAWVWSREVNATSTTPFNSGEWYWKQGDLAALWWGATNPHALRRAGGRTSLWFLEYDVEWSGSLADALSGHGDADLVTPIECARQTIAWAHFRERNYLNRTSVWSSVIYATRLSARLLAELAAELQRGRHYAYGELRACSAAKLRGWPTSAMRASSLGLVATGAAPVAGAAQAASSELCAGRASSREARLYHPCK